MKSTGKNRSFGLLLVAVFVLLGALGYWENRPIYIAWTGLAALFLLISLLLPRVLAPLRRGWIRIGEMLGRVMNPVVLGIVYIAVIIPVGGLMRLFRRNAIARTPAPAASSYWEARTGDMTNADSLKEQF